jgi:hypothetical protein
MYSFAPPSTSLDQAQLRKLSGLIAVFMLLSSLLLVTSRPLSLTQSINVSQTEVALGSPVAPEANFANQQDLSAVLYQAFAEGNNWVMINQAEQFEAQFDGSALSLALGAEHAWGLQLVSFGRDGALLPLPAEAQLVTQGSELQYVWSDSLREWYRNSPLGIEHGYTVANRPSGNGDLVVTLNVLGNLSPVMSNNGISFVDSTNTAVINYDKLFVFDANNVEQAAHFVLAGEQIQIVVDDRAAQYPLTIDPLVLRNPVTKASPSVGYERLGSSIAVYDNVMVVGASEATINSQTRAGAAYVFTRSGTGWTMQQRIVNPNPSANDYFGNSVAIENGVIAIGSPNEDSSGIGVAETITDNSSASDRGAVYLYKQVEGVWTLSHFVKPPTGTTPLTYRNFGEQVVLDEGRLFVSEPATDTTMNYAHNGTVHMFTADGNGAWAYDSSITASDGVVKDRFGYSFAVEGDTIAVGAPYHNSIQGAMYVFTYDGSAWVQQTKLTADDGEANDQFGHTVAIHDKFVFASAIGWDMSSSYQNAGAVYVFKHDEGAWTQAQKLSGPSTSNAQFGSGRNMLVAANILLIGSPRHTDMYYGFYGGSVWPAEQYSSTGDTWNLGHTQYSTLKPSGSTNTEFGMSMAYDPINYTLVVGGPKEGSASTGYESGSVYTYDLLGQAQVSYNGVTFSSSTPASATNGTAFGNVALNQTVTHTFTVSNTIEGKLIWGDPAYTVSNAAFSVNVPLTTTLHKGESTTFTISFTPTALQNYSGNVQLQFPGANNFYINVSGTGSANQIALTGNSTAISAGSTTPASTNNTDFASVNVGSTKTLTYTIANAGGIPLNISDISLSGADATQFSISNAPTTVANASSANFNITYTPTSAATHNATVTIASDNASTPSYSFAIAGQGLAPNIAVNDAAISFGDVNLGDAITKTYTISNTGSVALDISAVSLSGAHASDYTIVSAPSSIAVGQSANLQISFAPSAINARSASVNIASNALNNANYSFALNGKGTAALIALVNSGNQPINDGDTAISFGSVVLGANNTGSFTIKNTGNLPLTLSTNLSGSNASDFVIVSAPSTIAAGQSASVQVRFAPGALGARSASLEISSDAYNQASLTVGLSGNGSAVPPSPTPSPSPSPTPSPSPSPEQPGQKEYKVFIPIVNKGN